MAGDWDILEGYCVWWRHSSGFVQTDAPILGFGTDNGENIRATNLLVAAWFALFSLPIFLLVKSKRHQPLPDVRTLIEQANQQLVSTFLEISRRFRQVLRFLVARLVYNDGLITVFAFGGIYASTTFGFSTEKVIVFGITLNIAAGLGALAFGYIDDKLGGRKTIILSLVGLIGFGLYCGPCAHGDNVLDCRSRRGTSSWP